MRMRRIILSSVFWLSVSLSVCLYRTIFPTLSHQRHDCRLTKSLNTKCVFWFSLQHLSETFLIMRRTERDMTTNVYRSACKESVVLPDFDQTSIFSAYFRKILTRCCVRTVRETDRQTDRHTDRQTDRETDRPTNRQTHRQRVRKTDRPTVRQTDWKTERPTDRQSDWQSDRQSESDRQSVKQTDRRTQRQSDGQTVR